MKTKLSMSEQEIFRQWVKEQNVKAMSRYLFDMKLSPNQCEIVRSIVFPHKDRKRLLISAYTRYGKSRCVSIGVCMRVLFSKNKKVFLVAPTNDKTKILRDYIVKDIMYCKFLREILDIDVDKDEKLKKEVSKQRMTFKNGCVIQTLSAEGDGQRLMGWGLGEEGGLLIVDELAEIKKDVVYTKILRMMGDNPQQSQFIGLFNPWSKDTAAYDMWLEPEYTNIHIDWSKGIEEGRLDSEFLELQRKTLTKTQFQVLYDSMFPDETNEALIPFSDIEKARDPFSSSGNYEYLLGCDIAAFGVDFTVLTLVKHYLEEDIYVLEKIEEYRKQDTMTTVGNIIQLINQYEPSRVNIDGTGLGQGVYDRLTEQNYMVNDIKVGRASIDNPKLYLNQKAEMYDKLRKKFESTQIKALDHQTLIKELSIITKEIGSNGKLKIVDPEKSPDYADSLALCLFDEQLESFGEVVGFNF